MRERAIKFEERLNYLPIQIKSRETGIEYNIVFVKERPSSKDFIVGIILESGVVTTYSNQELFEQFTRLDGSSVSPY